MKWYLIIETKRGGRFQFPSNGFKTKQEALRQKELADNEPQNLNVRLIKK